MKNAILSLFTIILAFLFIPDTGKAAGLVKEELCRDSIRLKNELIIRLYEIKMMDKSVLSRKEKKKLRKEVFAINKNLHDNYGSAIISEDTITLFILLL